MHKVVLVLIFEFLLTTTRNYSIFGVVLTVITSQGSAHTYVRIVSKYL